MTRAGFERVAQMERSAFRIGCERRRRVTLALHPTYRLSDPFSTIISASKRHGDEPMKRIAITSLALALALGAASAQHQQPYASLKARSIKALSEEQIADLKAGRGMGLALPAELNGYPGPLHVLEHADALALTDVQRGRVRDLFDAMKAEAVPLGERLIAEEADLDRQFAAKTITPENLVMATNAIGATQAALRAAHLKYHLSTATVLTPQQVDRYRELRGYVTAAPPGHGHGDHR
jgi:Spy/CpxP family protein refolding chaperone